MIALTDLEEALMSGSVVTNFILTEGDSVDIALVLPFN